MKLTIKGLIAIACLSTLFFSSCTKTNDAKTSPVNAALESNKTALHNTLNTCDLSAKTPGDWWWADEDGSTSAVAASSRQAPASLPVNPKNYLRFTYLNAALAYTGLDAVLADPNTKYTLFAPNDQAFINAGFATIDDLLAVDKDALTQILLYHVVSGKVFAADVPLAVNTEVPSLQGASLFLTRKAMPAPNHKVSVDGAGVYIADIDLGNGVMHDINRVLMQPVGNIVETAIANPDFTYLVAAVVRASEGTTDVAAVLSGDGPFTLFAPTNQAFINAGFATIADINNADPDALAAILTYHVVAARVFSPDVKDGDMPVMLDGNSTTISRTGDIFFRDLAIKGSANTSPSMIGKRNIVATNGVIHVIDQVLLQ